MSARGSRQRRSFSRLSPPAKGGRAPAAWLPLSLALGGLLGLVVAGLSAASLATPEGVDPRQWRVISPGLDESIKAQEVGRGTHIVGGALTLTAHAFFRPDIVVAQVARPVHRVEVSLAPDSGTLWLSVGGRPSAMVLLHPEGYKANATPSWISSPSPDYAIDYGGGQFWVKPAGGEPALIGSGSPESVEISAADQQARVRAIRLLDEQGSELLAERFDERPLPAAAAAWGVALGALAGGCLAALARAGRPALGMALAVLPLLVCLVSSQRWLLTAERLYLAHTPGWELARIGLGLSLVPLVSAALARWEPLGVDLRPRREDDRAALAWAGAAGIAALVGARAWAGLEFLWLIPGLLFLGLVPLAGRRAGLPPASWLGRDLPALVAIGALGWGLGLLAAVGWRLLVLVASARLLLARAPRPAADHLFALLLLLPVAGEAALRSTYLRDTWNAAELSQELPSERGWQTVQATWSGECRPEAGRVVKTVFLGGSSTGGAYQFGGEPEAFFSAQAHDRLCEEGPAEVGFQTYNYGTGDGNTFTISRTIGDILAQTQAQVLVLYVGVNDIFTRHHAQTRKQREEALEEQRAAMRGLAGLARRSRAVTGASLLLRPLPDLADNVSAVPIPDAEENLGRIAAAAAAAGARVLLLTELITPSMAAELRGYDQMQQRVAASHPNARWVDVSALLGVTDADELLVDRNHLSREGNRKLGAVLAPLIREQAGLR